MIPERKKLSKYDVWILAIRPKTLFAAVVPVLVGSALAFNKGKFYLLYSLLALICSFLIQIGTNLTNDLYDHIKGADTSFRKGPLRVISSGLISSKEIKLAIFFSFGLTFLIGLYLVYVTDWKIFVIGVLSILAGIAYTAGPFPLAYNGLGDLFVFIFFGVVGTMGTFYLHLKEFSLLSFLVSIPVGALITNILIVNNYRDIDVDRRANKKTLAVILGKKFSQFEFILLLVSAFLIPIILFIYYEYSFFLLLPFISIPIAIRLVKMLLSYSGKELNITLEKTAKFSALFGFLFSIGFVVDRFY